MTWLLHRRCLCKKLQHEFLISLEGVKLTLHNNEGKLYESIQISPKHPTNLFFIFLRTLSGKLAEMCLLEQMWPLVLDLGRKQWALQEVCFVEIKTKKTRSQLSSATPSITSCDIFTTEKHECTLTGRWLTFDVADSAWTSHRDKALKPYRKTHQEHATGLR